MSEGIDLQASIKEAIQTEKDAMDFYLTCCRNIREEKPKAVFEILAREERQHAKMFYNIYKGGDIGTFDEFMERSPNVNSSWYKVLSGMSMADFDERKAMELAIEQEELLEEQLVAVMNKIDDPEVKTIYEANARSTHNHAALITTEYKAIYG